MKKKKMEISVRIASSGNIGVFPNDIICGGKIVNFSIMTNDDGEIHHWLRPRYDSMIAACSFAELKTRLAERYPGRKWTYPWSFEAAGVPLPEK
jgi:hypothetical protein